ncbi:MAG: lysozyme inhibitor LprI family protein [Methylococcales bacterium]
MVCRDYPTNEPAKQLSSSPLDEANTKINTVWNGTTKEVRAMLLPEQRAWLKQRESDCSLVAEKINCMVTMTDLRTEILKQKIAVLEKKS